MPSARLVLPRLYAILDAYTLIRTGADLVETAEELRAAGITLFQYRDKQHDRPAAFSEARRLRSALHSTDCQLILNDDAHAASALGFDGVHVGQLDMDVIAARRIVGMERILGMSNHNRAQIQEAEFGPADYLAIGPVFSTDSKADAEPVIGLEGVRRARELTSKPLVAIGGISASNARAVLNAGADSIAVIGALLSERHRVGENARRLLEIASEQVV